MLLLARRSNGLLRLSTLLCALPCARSCPPRPSPAQHDRLAPGGALRLIQQQPGLEDATTSAAAAALSATPSSPRPLARPCPPMPATTASPQGRRCSSLESSLALRIFKSMRSARSGQLFGCPWSEEAREARRSLWAVGGAVGRVGGGEGVGKGDLVSLVCAGGRCHGQITSEM